MCQPVGISAARDPLQIIGTTGGADISSLASRTALTAFAPGPINAVDPDPFPAPQVRTYSYSTSTSIDFGLPDWRSALVGTLSELTSYALMDSFPEVGVPAKILEYALAA